MRFQWKTRRRHSYIWTNSKNLHLDWDPEALYFDACKNAYHGKIACDRSEEGNKCLLIWSPPRRQAEVWSLVHTPLYKELGVAYYDPFLNRTLNELRNLAQAIQVRDNYHQTHLPRHAEMEDISNEGDLNSEQSSSAGSSPRLRNGARQMITNGQSAPHPQYLTGGQNGGMVPTCSQVVAVSPTQDHIEVGTQLNEAGRCNRYTVLGASISEMSGRVNTVRESIMAAPFSYTDLFKEPEESNPDSHTVVPPAPTSAHPDDARRD
jgi:hypothetical protein